MTKALAVFLLAIPMIASCASGNGKKVYADYHGVRYTRRHDGKLGRWEMYADTYNSVTGRRTLCYNADLIDSSGRHDIAATAYPQAGMQSNLDEDYIEYQILSAKAAKIDGFFIEWGFFPHENDVLLKAMQRVAAKYDFEIGVNWCDGWLYYDWITRIHPEIDSREAKTGYMVKCWQYLVDSVFSVKTAPIVNGRPVFYHFGAGATPDEFSRVLSEVRIPERMDSPVGLHRWADWGTLEDGRYVPVTRSDEMDSWKAVGEIPVAWLPARVRTFDKEHPYWDNYAEMEDLIEFMKPFRDSIWRSSDPDFVVKSGFAMPGMDNRGCAGWGRGHFFYIPRNEGATYEAMWKFCMEDKDSLDMMFLASWSDYTEGHEIEPTIENGDRELRTTLKYASEFKEESFDDRGLDLPLQLFKLRKELLFLEECGVDVPGIGHDLDAAASRISSGRYRAASRLLSRSGKRLDSAKSAVRYESVSVDCPGPAIVLPEELTARLESCYYTGYVSFEYLDEGREYLFVRSSTSRSPEDMFSIVGKVRTDGSGEWKPARIEMFKENIAFRKGQPALFFSGDVEVRGISLDFKIYTVD